MCGLFGVRPHSGQTCPDKDLVEQSARLLAHRGPDARAIHVAPGIGLAHTRLALVDLDSRSEQPFWDERRRHALVYNGEIYNFTELRADLEKEGIRFRTTSDTEVVLASLIHFGAREALRRFEGMFAFAWWDSLTGELVLARDRFGIKPLFVATGPRGFVFASEIAALRPWIDFEPDPIVAAGILCGFGGPTRGASLLQGVGALCPGEIATLTSGARPRVESCLTLAELWMPSERERLSRASDEDVVAEVDSALQRAVRAQMSADASVGALASGGVDSSVVAALARRSVDDLSLFHANVVGRHSELDAARDVAAHIGVPLDHADATDDDFLAMLPEVTRHYGQPFWYHPNSVAFLKVARLIAGHGVKAIVSGEGADECFIGYPWMIREAGLDPRERLRSVGRRVTNRLQTWLGASQGGSVNELASEVLSRFEPALESTELADAVREREGRAVPNAELVTLRALGYHLRTLLHRNDAMGMAAGIEARFPYLDGRLVELAVNLPARHKVRLAFDRRARLRVMLRDKWALRRAAVAHLPDGLANRRKLGFPTSQSARLRIDRRLFERSRLADVLSLSSEQTRRLLGTDHATRVRMLHLEIWCRVGLDGASDEAVGGFLREHVGIEPEGALAG